MEVTPVPQYGKLAQALAKAQSEIKLAVKDSQNPFFKSSYADLASVWEACREPLTKNGLAVVQRVASQAPQSAQWVLITSLLHSSGEFIESAVPLITKDQDMQKFKAAVTYARRIGLGAMVGVCDVDDDGESAVGRHHQGYTTAAPYQWRASDAQSKRLFAIAKANGWGEDNFEPLKNLMSVRFNKISTSDLDKHEYDAVCSHMEQNKWSVKKGENENEFEG